MTTRQPMDAYKDGVIVVLSMPFLMFFGAAMSAWPLMLGLGVTHHAITARVPALGFWATFALSWALGVLVGRLAPAKTPKRSAS